MNKTNNSNNVKNIKNNDYLILDNKTIWLCKKIIFRFSNLFIYAI